MLRGTGTAERRRSGFTLPEILVVMLIIIVLAGLLIPAVFKVQDSAKRSETGWQITQISQGADLYCNSEVMGRVGYLPAPPFRLRNNYPPAGFDYEVNYLKNVFPNWEPRPTTGTNGLPNADLDGNQIVVFFLTGGTTTNYSGFATNSQRPFNLPDPNNPGEKRKGPFLQLKENMYETNPGGGLTPNGQAWLVDAYRVPFAIFLSGQDKSYRNSPVGDPTAGQSFAFATRDGTSTVRPYARSSGTALKFENPKGIQIISAGRDKNFGPGPSPDPTVFLSLPPVPALRATNWSAVVENKHALDDSSNFSTAGLGYGPN